jgi:hypothetical protein
MAEYASLDELATVSDDTEDVTLPSGVKVLVRGLTRYELLTNGRGTDDSSLIERRNLATCLVAPKLTIGQAERWQKASKPGDIGIVTDAIRRLSGLGEGAQKSSVPADGDDGA